MNAAHHGDKLSAPQGLRRFLLPPAGSARPFLVTFVATVCALAIPTYLAREYAAIAAAERLRGALQQEQARTVRAMRQQVEETLFSVTSDLLLLRSLVERAIAGDEDLAALRNTLRAFAESHADYLQLRFLDTQGQERVRIDHDASGIVVVPDALLQDKSQRYYVQAAETLPANGVLITPADFNREHGAVELPLRLVMRVVTPVHVNGERAGLAILNYRARILLENLRAVGSAGIGTPSVVNSLGRDALSTLDLPTQAAPRDPDVFERDFAQRHPDAWAQIRGQRTGVIDDGAGGLISHVRLEPASLAGGDRFSQPVHWRLPLDEQGPVGGWHLVSHLDAADFAAIAALGSTRSHVTFALTAALLLAVAWLLAVRVADLRARARQLRDLATRDYLTGLFNRFEFDRRLSAALAHAQRFNRSMAVLYIDLDRFKEVNDRYGHDAGDLLLQHVADTLREGLRGSDVLARLGGDEFAVILLETSTAEAAEQVADKLRRGLALPFSYRGVTMPVGASVGAATYPEQGSSAEDLTRFADAAMYADKTRRQRSLEAVA